MQVQADVYEKLDKELLGYVEDVLLNRREDSTERMLDYAATLDPKSKPTQLQKLIQEDTGPSITPRLNPIADDVDPLAPLTDLPPVPQYKAWQDPLKKSPAFEHLRELMEQRIMFIDGAMGTSIQKHKCVGSHEFDMLANCLPLSLVLPSVAHKYFGVECQ